ncbi:MAG TPA: transposase [Candidatus Paceibacterota bacterium]|nr:transposase [Candidatus Paceibacterota bacterium]
MNIRSRRSCASASAACATVAKTSTIPDTLRQDPAWQMAVEQIKPPASSPTLCRLENRADRAATWALHGILVDQFIAAFRRRPAS